MRPPHLLSPAPQKPGQPLSFTTAPLTPAARAALKGHAGHVLWFTGLSGAGKSTLANALDQALHAQGAHTVLLDGDQIRHGLCRDLGFSDADRAENIRRVAEVAGLMADAGLLVLVAFISPFRRDREGARALIGAQRFTEVYVDTPLAVCEQRDVKGLYKKARAGQLPLMTGIGSPYEPPDRADIVLSGAAPPEHTLSLLQRESGLLLQRLCLAATE